MSEEKYIHIGQSAENKTEAMIAGENTFKYLLDNGADKEIKECPW